MLGLKFIFRKSNGKVLGAQALGEDGPAVDKRISAMAVAIQMGATIYDLEEVEMCYAPQFGSAKDPVNFAGMVAADVLRGDMPLSHWDTLDGAFLLDVRMPAELVVESVPGAVNIPLPQLRSRLGELPRDREIHVICRSAQRAYYATRILLQNGFKVKNISGGMHGLRGSPHPDGGGGHGGVDAIDGAPIDQGLTISTWALAKPLLLTILLPLIIGAVDPAYAETGATRIFPAVKGLAQLSTLLTIVWCLVLYGRGMLNTAGSFALLSMTCSWSGWA
jgi:rhodanese-related sulfurtransferase